MSASTIIHAYAWASGLIQFGLEVPEGACAVCHGDEHVVEHVLSVMAEARGHGLSQAPFVPGSQGAALINQHNNMTALLKWLKWCRAGPTKTGLTWHGQTSPIPSTSQSDTFKG